MCAQDGTFVLCTVHEKKGYLPAFLGYTRKQEMDLLEFAKMELMDLVYHKKTVRFFSDNLKMLADPNYSDSPPPSPTPKKKKTQPKRKAGEAALAALAKMSPPPSEPESEGELPAAPPSPFPSPQIAAPRVRPSPLVAAGGQEQRSLRLRRFLGGRGRGLDDRDAPRPVAEYSEEFVRDPEPPPGFKLSLRFSGQASATAPLALALVDDCGAPAVSHAATVADLRRRIDKLTKKAARERHVAETAIRHLKQASKQGSRDLYLSLGRMDTHLSQLQRTHGRLHTQRRYWRGVASKLEMELAMSNKKLREAREEAACASRRALEAESLLSRKEALLEKNVERRKAAEHAYQDKAGSLKEARLFVRRTQSSANATQAQLEAVEAEREELPAIARTKARSTQTHGGQQGATRASSLEEQSDDDQDDEADKEREVLAVLTKHLMEELQLSRQHAAELQTQLDISAEPAPPANVPKFVEMEHALSDRSKRRATQTDVEYLEEILSQRPWRAADVARALEKVELIAGVCDSRPVRVV